MKNRTIVGIVLLVFAVAISTASVFITQIICEDIESTVDHTETLILQGESQLAMESAQKLSDDWDKQFRILSSYIDHEDLERCEVAINAVGKYLSLDDYAAALVMCQDIKVSAEHIFISERPAFWNVL